MSAELSCPCCAPDEALLDALSELLLGTSPMTEEAVDILNQNAWEMYG